MNKFEKVSNETMDDTGNSDMRENCIYWLDGDKRATVNFTQARYITRVKELAKKFPEDVKIMSEKNGVLVATLPVKAIKVNLVKLDRELTDKEIAARKSSLEKARLARLSVKSTEENE